MITFIFWIAFCCLVGAIAKKVGMNFWTWTLISALISPLLGGIILAICACLKKSKN